MAKILVLDIETAPETAYTWRRYKENISQSQVKEPGYLLCMAWFWIDERNMKPSAIESISIFKSKAWNRGDRTNDLNVVKKAHEILSKADIVIGHNIKDFDIGTLNARFIYHGFPPPTPFKICDTLKILKKTFHMPSYSLESVSHYFGIEIKEKQPFTLWLGCLKGLQKSWDKMVDYCRHDVYVTSQLYLKLRPWAVDHPNISLYEDNREMLCPKCGSNKMKKQGIRETQVNRYQRYRCEKCGGWSRGRYCIKNIDKMNILTNVI